MPVGFVTGAWMRYPSIGPEAQGNCKRGVLRSVPMRDWPALRKSGRREKSRAESRSGDVRHVLGEVLLNTPEFVAQAVHFSGAPLEIPRFGGIFNLRRDSGKFFHS